MDVHQLVSRILHREVLPRIADGRTLPARGDVLLRCPIEVAQPGGHKNGDGKPSFSIDVGKGVWRCPVHQRAGGVKALVVELYGEDQWQRWCAQHGDGGGAGPARQPEDWERLPGEQAWTDTYSITPELSRRYLRRGRRYPQDPESDSSIAVRSPEGKILGTKWRIRRGETWQVGSLKGKGEDHAKYAWRRGAKDAGALDAVFLADLERQRGHTSATLVVCGGEKDALVAASHLDPERWAPVATCRGETSRRLGALPELARGRRVVVAYDGDRPGQLGGQRVAAMLLAAGAAEVRVARLPEEPKDVADYWRAYGTAPLVELLERAEVVSAEAGAAAAGERELSAEEAALLDPADAGDDAEPAAGSGGPPAGGLKHPLDAWSEVDGVTVESRWVRAGKEWEEEQNIKFDGVASVKRIDSRWAIDEDTGEWAEEKRITYCLRLSSGRTITSTTEPGSQALMRILETEAPEANALGSATDRARFFQWVWRKREAAEVVEVRRAIGPVRGTGWLAPPGVLIQDGKVSEAPHRVEPPAGTQDLERYRLAVIDDARALEVARWVRDHLLRCDHAGGAYSTRLLGAVLCPVLYEYVPVMGDWQWSVDFLVGPSGIGKSVLAHYFMCFWGDFLRLDGLTTWKSTPTYVEDLLHRVRVAPVFVSDWKPANFCGNPRKIEEARGILQAYGDRSSRGRANSRAETKRKKNPRAGFLVDGESLPHNEQSTLGRLTILRVVGSREGRCATAHPGVLEPAMVRDLPGLTARWIAWVQRNTELLSGWLTEAMEWLERSLPQGSTNRSRILRAYAARVLAVRAFFAHLDELEGGTAFGPELELVEVSDRAHLAGAIAQLGDVQGESLSQQFLSGLRAVLLSGEARLVEAEVEQWKAGANPFPDHMDSARRIGAYDADHVYVWPEAALPVIQQWLSKGGGARIGAERRDIAQMLRQDGYLLGSPKARGIEGAEGKIERGRVWKLLRSVVVGRDEEEEE